MSDYSDKYESHECGCLFVRKCSIHAENQEAKAHTYIVIADAETEAEMQAARVIELEADLKEAEELLREYGTDDDGDLYPAVREWLELKESQ